MSNKKTAADIYVEASKAYEYLDSINGTGFNSEKDAFVNGYQIGYQQARDESHREKENIKESQSV